LQFANDAVLIPVGDFVVVVYLLQEREPRRDIWIDLVLLLARIAYPFMVLKKPNKNTTLEFTIYRLQTD